MRHEGGQTSNGPLAVTRTTKGHGVKLYGGNLTLRKFAHPCGLYFGMLHTLTQSTSDGRETLSFLLRN